MKSEIFQLQSMLNLIICIDQRFAVKTSDMSCLALIFNLNRDKKPENYNLASKKAVPGC